MTFYFIKYNIIKIIASSKYLIKKFKSTFFQICADKSAKWVVGIILSFFYFFSRAQSNFLVYSDISCVGSVQIFAILYSSLL